MLLIGSQAFDMGREPRDTDMIATPAELADFKSENADKIVLVKPSKFGETIFMQGEMPIEIDYSETGQELYNICENNSDLAYYSCRGDLVAYPEVLLALKMSHRFLKNSKNFLKTMEDIWYLRNRGVRVPEALEDWVKRRSKATYDYSSPKLNQSKEDFFTSNFPYQYMHDDIHEAVKLYEKPIFELIKADKADVFCSKERFFSLDRKLQLATVYEESTTLALERSQLTHNFEVDPFWSFTKALEKVCTNISSGWWRTFSWENYYEVKSMYDPTYVDKFKAALVRGEILPYAG